MQNILAHKKLYAIFFGIVALFLILRLPAIHSPYHQDEYKWPIIVNPDLTPPGGIPHPPLSEAVYRATFHTFGSDNFRVTPLLFSLINLGLLFVLVRKRFSLRAAMWSTAFFALSYYSVLASLMIDTDGAVLPFLFLLSLLVYDRAYEVGGRDRWWWGTLLLLIFIAGMLTKMSFIIAIGTIFLDILIREGHRLDRKKVAYIFGGAVVLGIVFSILLYVAQNIFAGFDLAKAVSYWETFVKGFGSRNFFQTAIQFVKALLYLSPFLVLGGLLSLKSYSDKTRIFYLFILLGLIFYTIIFDFSAGALDRYFQFMIVPLCVLTGVLTSVLMPQVRGSISKRYVLGGAVLAVLIFLLQFVDHFVPSLYPKSEWVGRVLSLRWNFLYPFSGGSGPLTFYVSFLFLALSWVLGLIASITFLIKKNLKKEMWIVLMIVGLMYNTVFIEEYTLGKINGFAPTLVRDAVAYIESNPDIKRVVVYNDNGGREVQATGKYEKRLYTADYFDQVQKAETINNFSGHYMVVDAPRIDPESIYAEYLAGCDVVYEEVDQYMSAKVYDCREALNILDFD